METRGIMISADKITFSGPNIDGGYRVTFHTGEYSQKQVAELMNIPQNTTVEVYVTISNNGRR